MKILSVDLGSKHIGLAISDEKQIMAFPYLQFDIKENDYNYAVEKVKNIYVEEKCCKIVLGYPLNMDDSEGEKALLSISFKQKLEALVGCEIILVDERLTTKDAYSVMIKNNTKRKKKKKKIDKIAAAIILQNYLDHIK